MASQKISAMPAAAAVNNADVLPIVQGGVNKKATRDVLLTAAAGEDLNMFGQTCTVSLAHSFQNQITSSIQLTIQTIGGVVLRCQSGFGFLQCDNLGATIQGQAGGYAGIADNLGASLFTVGGSILAGCASTKNIQLQYNGVTQFTIEATGTHIAVTGSQTVVLSSAGGSLTVAASGLVTISLSSHTIQDAQIDRHVGSAGMAPSIAPGIGAGSGPILSIQGSDLHGTISLKTGAGTIASAQVCRITPAAAWASAPIVVLSPANAATAALGVATPFVTSTNANWDINANTTRLVASTQYAWYYHVLGV